MNQSQPSTPDGPVEKSHWNPARPEIISQPTVWPATLALAATLILWGFASTFIISLIGLCLFAVALAGWIGEIRHERKSH
jgi:hypothetical protein